MHIARGYLPEATQRGLLEGVNTKSGADRLLA